MLVLRGAARCRLPGRRGGMVSGAAEAGPVSPRPDPFAACLTRAASCRPRNFRGRRRFKHAMPPPAPFAMPRAVSLRLPLCRRRSRRSRCLRCSAPRPARPSTRATSRSGPTPRCGRSPASTSRPTAAARCVFTMDDGGVEHVFVSRLVNGAWSGPERLDAGLAGAVFAAGRRRRRRRPRRRRLRQRRQRLRRHARQRRGTGWVRQTLWGGGGASSPAVDLSVNGKGYLAFTAPGAGGHDVRAAYARDAGAWTLVGAPLDANAGNDAGVDTGRAHVAASADGVAIVVWGEGGHVFARRVQGARPSVVVGRRARRPDDRGRAGGRRRRAGRQHPGRRQLHRRRLPRHVRPRRRHAALARGLPPPARLALRDADRGRRRAVRLRSGLGRPAHRDGRHRPGPRRRRQRHVVPDDGDAAALRRRAGDRSCRSTRSSPSTRAHVRRPGRRDRAQDARRLAAHAGRRRAGDPRALPRRAATSRPSRCSRAPSSGRRCADRRAARGRRRQRRHRRRLRAGRARPGSARSPSPRSTSRPPASPR